MSDRASRIVHVLLMAWLTVTLSVAWLPALRGLFDGPSYEWGANLFGISYSGAGLTGDYGYAALNAAIALALLWTGWRSPNGAFRPVLTLWLAFWLASTLYSVVASPDDYRFRGDTLGVDISLAWIGPGLGALMALLALWWWLRAPEIEVPPLAGINRMLIALFLLLVPGQYALLSAGRGQDGFDVAGVAFTLMGWVLLSFGLGIRRWPSGP